MKTIKSRSLKILKIFEKKKIVGTLLSASWVGEFQRKNIIKNYNYIRAGTQKAGKIVSVFSSIDTHFVDI